MTKFIRFREPWATPCVMFEFAGETAKFWKYRRGHEDKWNPGGIERQAKTYRANVDQGLGITGMGRFRGDAREDSSAHFEPCPHCPDYKQESNDGQLHQL